jgi:amidohydrolase
MDALPIRETNSQDYVSRVPGVMHACGHDAHVSALLGAATLLAARQDHLVGSVRFLFQPAEEVFGGALAMIADGALDGVDRVLGAHVNSPAPFGQILLRPGAFLAGADIFELTVIGQAGHGGMPQTGVDPVYAAAQVVTALQSIVARETNPRDALVVSIAAIQGGSAANVVVDEVTLRGTIRWFTEADRARALTRVREIASGVCGALRARTRFQVTGSAPVTSSTGAEVDVVQEAVAATGRASVVDPGLRTASEDFAYFLQKVPGCFFGVGAGGQGAAPHHHHAFDIDERAIGLMAELFTRVTLLALRPDGE